MNEKQLKDLIDRVLEKIDLYSKDAADLVLKTMKVESQLKYIRQLNNGILSAWASANHGSR